ncbi:hypothetical protein ANCDUO_15760 [Ancylostoma duodenale]|uniref:Uncharacterized protein n=1 Tax=Ancylostoma duodenale TaxID=51022 RepID=A0A0C2G5B9_9BILA|nr:hypothetical protein ANCDUO_15760 [Ancylostoma duodenale]
MLRITRLMKVRSRIRSSTQRQQSKIREAAAKLIEIRWAGNAMRFNDNLWTRAVSDWTARNVKRTPGRSPTSWSDFFKEGYSTPRVPRVDRTLCKTLAHERDRRIAGARTVYPKINRNPDDQSDKITNCTTGMLLTFYESRP